MLILITCSRWCLVFSTILVIMFCLVTSKQCVRKTLLRLCLSSKFPLWVSIYWWFLPGSMSGKIPTPSMFTSWHLAFYCNRVSFLIRHSSVNLFTIGVDSWTLVLSMACDSLLYFIILVLRLSQTWQWETLHSGFLEYATPHFFLSTSLLSDTRYSRLILHLARHIPGVSHFSKEMFSFVGEWI